jgi:hypothetical protein
MISTQKRDGVTPLLGDILGVSAAGVLGMSGKAAWRAVAGLKTPRRAR